MAIDPSGTGADETSYAVIGVLNGNLFLIDWGGFREGYSENTLIQLATIAKEYQVQEMVPEKNFGAGIFGELLRKTTQHIYPCYIVDDFNSRGQKERRIIDNVGPVLGKHQLIVNEDKLREEVEWVQEMPAERLQYSLIYQLTHITYDKGSIPHDDRLDALAIGCQYLMDYVIVDAETQLKQIEEIEFEKWLYEKVYAKAPTQVNSVLPHKKGGYNLSLGVSLA
jgi:hypothetical protein